MNDACLCSCKCNEIKELNTWGVTLFFIVFSNMSFLWLDVFYGTVSWQWCICYDIVYMYTTWVWCNRNNISIIIIIDSRKCRITDGLYKSLVIWNRPVVMVAATPPQVQWWWRGLHLYIVRQIDGDTNINDTTGSNGDQLRW
jgi:hypothetical protein